MLATKHARLLGIVRALSPLVRPWDDFSRRLQILEDPEGTRFAVYGRECGGSILARDVHLEILGGVAVDLPLFEKILSASDSRNVRLDIGKSDLRISFDRAVLSIPLLEPGFTPPYTEPQTGLRFRTDPATLRTGLRRIEYVLDERAMPLGGAIHGRYIVFDLDSASSESILLAGIENRRLSVFRLPVRFETENTGGRFLVLPETFGFLFRAFHPGKDEEIAISMSRNVAFFGIRDREAFAAGVNVSVPDFIQRVDRLASSSRFEAKVPVREMRAALRQLAPVVDPEYRRVELEFGRDLVLVRSRGALRGETLVHANCTVPESKRVLVDHRLVSDHFETCSSLGDSEVRILFGDPHDALFFVNGVFPCREPNGNFHVLMPIVDDRRSE